MQSPIAIALFVVVIVSTLLITRWAARRTHSRSEFYAAGSSITGTQNGLAIAVTGGLNKLDPGQRSLPTVTPAR
jgi:Na+(H+)/acetate symporter ActP